MRNTGFVIHVLGGMVLAVSGLKAQVPQNILYNGSFEQGPTGAVVDSTNYVNPFGQGTTGLCPTASGSSATYADMQAYWGYVYGWDVPDQRTLCSNAGNGPGSADVENGAARTGLLGESSSGREYAVNSFRTPGIKKGQVYYVEFYNKVSATGWDDRGLRFYDFKPRHCTNTAIKDDGPPHIRALNTKNSSWGKTQTYFVPSHDYDWLALGPFNGASGKEAGSFDDFRIFPLGDDWCADEDWMFQNTDLYSDIFQASDEIYAGSNVMNHAYAYYGPVTIKSNNNVIFKAGNRVVMEDGFSTEDDAYFETVIEPCSGGFPCHFDFPTVQDFYEVCDGNPIQIGPDPETGLVYSWSPSSNLSADNVANPTFTPPAGNGTITYTLTVSTICGGFFTGILDPLQTSTEYQVTVVYGDAPSPPTVSTSNEIYGQNNVSFDIEVNDDVQWICVEAPFSSYSQCFYPGQDFSCCTLPFSADFTNCLSHNKCNDEPINITVKNYCHPPITTTLDWQKPVGPIAVGPMPNIQSYNGDGVNDYLCFQAQNARWYDIQIFDRWGGLEKHDFGCVLDDEVCITSFPVSSFTSDGTYYYIIEFQDCDGNTYDYTEFFLFENGFKSLGNDSAPKDSTKPVIQNGKLKVYPNPGSGVFRVESDLSSPEIQVLNMQGQIVFIQNPYEFTGTLDLSMLGSGSYLLRAIAPQEVYTVITMIDK